LATAHGASRAVDTADNVLDLVKAGVGIAYNEGRKLVTRKPSAAPAWTSPYDRSQVPGSSEWIAAKLNDVGLGTAINTGSLVQPRIAALRATYWLTFSGLCDGRRLSRVALCLASKPFPHRHLTMKLSNGGTGRPDASFKEE
jgi:hypothetical protein